MRKYVEIEHVSAREVLNSKGKPTIEVEVMTEEGDIGRAIVPSDDSNNEYIAHEIHDGDKKRYGGKGVLNAVNNINSVIAQEIEGLNVLNQIEIDETLIDLDGTENKSKLGANAILGVSIACSKAAACNLQIPLYEHLGGISGRNIPAPMANVISGENNATFKEFLIIPKGIDFFSERIRMCSEVYWKLKNILQENDYTTSVVDDGGFAPNLKSNEEALNLISQAIYECGYKDYFGIGINVVANNLFKDEYELYGEAKTANEMISYYEDLISKYQIIAIEDGMATKDIDGWKNMNRRLGDKIQLIGSDVFSTNVSKLIDGIDNKIANSVLIKPIQAGTLTETIDVIRMAKSHGYSSIISQCSSETEDAFIADLAVGLNAKYVKFGALSRSERVCKYNRLLRIEEMVGRN